MVAPDRERLIERADSGKLKLRGRSALPGLSTADRMRARNRRADRTHRWVSGLPKCPALGGAQRAAIKGNCRFFLAPTKELGAGGDRRSFVRSGNRSRLHGWIPMAVDGTSAPGCPRIFPYRFPPASGDLDRHSSRMACGAKIRGSGRGAALRLPSARLWRAPALFRLPGHDGKAIATGHSPTRWSKTMRNIAEFTLIGRVGTMKQVGKTVRVSICANYPFKDDKGQWKDDAHWNEVTIFTKAIQSYVSEHVSKGDLVHVRGRLRQNSYERDGQRVYTVDLIALEVGRLAQASERTAA
jgi:hypothetical protein